MNITFIISLFSGISFINLGETELELHENGTEIITTTFVVINNNSEIMIPLVDDFLIDINRDKKTLTFNLPEGLTTL